MPGSIQQHTLVYTVAPGLLLTAFFDLSRIAAPGITFYLIMDIAIHWGVLRHLRKEVDANPVIPVMAIVLDLIVLSGFLWVKVASESLDSRRGRGRHGGDPDHGVFLPQNTTLR